MKILKFNQYRIAVFTIILCVSCIISCENATNVKTVINEVYSVKGDGNEIISGDLLYKDSIVYQHESLPLTKYIFNRADQSISGMETYPKVENQTELQSEYTDKDGNRLSYYKYTLNSSKQKIRSEAFDASNDDLLRYEEMDYDNKNQLSSRRIFTSVGQLSSSYSFVHDAYGNEIVKVTQHLLRDTMITEESKITKYDSEKNWVEKWGFIEDKPVAYYKRKVTTH